MSRIQKALIVALPLLLGLGVGAVLLSKPESTGQRRSGGAPTRLLGGPLESVRAPNPLRKGPGPREVDLLEQVRTSRDAVHGAWGFQADSLVSPSVQWGRLALPCIPPEEYDLRITATRRQGTDSLNLGFVYRGRQGMLMVDGNGGETSWIDLVSPYDLPSNETSVVGKFLKWNRPARLILSVRKEGVTLSVDGAKIIDWKGDPAELKLIPGYRVPERRALFIGCWETILIIDELVLVPVTGTPVMLQ